ncbi:MAG TPA: hypothetical protein VH371_09950 [Candidatus Limnocylindrales bacterium]
MALAPGPLGMSGWIALGASENGGSAYPVWSPDGAHALMIGRLQGKDEATLISSTGDVVRSYDQADYAVWLDNDRFLIISYGPGQGDRPNIGTVGTVGGSALSSVDIPSGVALSNGHGAVTFATLGFDYASDCDFGCPLYHYRVWNGDETTDEQEGEPVAWSQDGSQLYVLHDVRNRKPDTGAPAAEDFIGWLEIFAMPDLRSVSQYPDTKIDDRAVALDPSGHFVSYEIIGDTNGSETAHILDLADGTDTSFNVFQRSFGWDNQQQMVVAPQLHDPLEAYGSDGERTYLKPVHGAATVYTAKSEFVGTLEDVGQSVSSSSDGKVVALYDEQFMNSFPFVTLYIDGQRTYVDPFPPLANSPPDDGYFFDCSVSSGSKAISATCHLTQYGSVRDDYLTAIYPLAN